MYFEKYLHGYNNSLGTNGIFFDEYILFLFYLYRSRQSEIHFLPFSDSMTLPLTTVLMNEYNVGIQGPYNHKRFWQLVWAFDNPLNMIYWKQMTGAL